MILSLKMGLLFSLLSLSVSAFAQTETEYTGSIDLLGQGYLKKTDSRFFSDTLQSRGEAEFKIKNSESLRGVVSAQFRIEPQNKSKEEQSYGEVKEAFLQIGRKTQTVKMGYVLFNWESTDVINPLDVIHQKNWRDPLNSWNRTAPTLAYSGSSESFSWDLVYIPKQQQSLLPGTNSPWLPRNVQIPLNTTDIAVLAPNEFNYVYASPEIIETALDNNWGGRLQFRGDGLDVSVVGYEGVIGNPLLVPVLNGTIVQVSPKTVIQLNGDIELIPRYFKTRMWGSGVTFTHDLWIFRLAASRVQPWTKSDLVPSYMTDTYVVGVEKSWEISEGSLVTLLQVSQIKKGSSATVAGSAALFDRASMAGVRWGPSETSQMLFAYLYDDINRTKIYRISGKRSFTDSLAGFFSADLIEASGESLLSAYADNDRIQLGLSLAF